MTLQLCACCARVRLTPGTDFNTEPHCHCTIPGHSPVSVQREKVIFDWSSTLGQHQGNRPEWRRKNAHPYWKIRATTIVQLGLGLSVILFTAEQISARSRFIMTLKASLRRQRSSHAAMLPGAHTDRQGFPPLLTTGLP